MSDNASTALNFSRAAASYHARAALQREVAGRLLQYLSAPVWPRRVLELGCGTGFLTRHLLDALAPAHLDALDLSAAMVEQARRVIRADEAIRWLVCDIREYHPTEAYDLIASSSSLQWMQPLEDLFSRLAHILLPEGRLVCSLMVDGTLGELHRLRREIAPHKCPRHRLPTIAETIESLRKAGFVVTRSCHETLRTRYRTTTELLDDLSKLGFNGGPLAQSSVLLTRGELARLADRYASACTLPGGHVGADFVVLYFEAIKSFTS
jgi:malonyl-CoA O-methyltransferase